MSRAVQPGAHHRGEPDRARTDDGDDVAGSDLAVQDADLVAGREDVGEHQDLFVRHARGHLVGGGVGERNAHVLGLRPVDLVTEDPTAATQALSVAAFAAVTAGAAGGDARDEHAVADLHVLHARADGLDRTDRLVAEDPAVGHGGDIALQDVKVGAADGDGIDTDDRVGVVDDDGHRNLFPCLLTGTVVHDCTHRHLLCVGFSIRT